MWTSHRYTKLAYSRVYINLIGVHSIAKSEFELKSVFCLIKHKIQKWISRLRKLSIGFPFFPFFFFSKGFEQFIFLKIAGLACECMINTNKRPLFTRTNL